MSIARVQTSQRASAPSEVNPMKQFLRRFVQPRLQQLQQSRQHAAQIRATPIEHQIAPGRFSFMGAVACAMAGGHVWPGQAIYIKPSRATFCTHCGEEFRGLVDIKELVPAGPDDLEDDDWQPTDPEPSIEVRASAGSWVMRELDLIRRLLSPQASR
jgi:hypothetical protein